MSFNAFWNGNRGRGYTSRGSRGWHCNSPGPGYMRGGPPPFRNFGSGRRPYGPREGRGSFNPMFHQYYGNNEQPRPSYRDHQFFPDQEYDIPQFSEEKPFLSPPRSNRVPSRAPSPLPGSEEYMQRDISEKSALLKLELEREGSFEDFNLSTTTLNSESDVADIDNDNKCVQQESPVIRSSKVKKQKPPQVQTKLSASEIHDKLINHISNLSYNKKYNIVNQSGPSGYNFAMQQIARQIRSELSKALRDMCNNKFKESEESSAVINSIIPDFDIKIESLPLELVQQLSSTLNEDIGESSLNASTIDPEMLFQQAANMLTYDNFDTASDSPASHDGCEQSTPVPTIPNITESESNQMIFSNVSVMSAYPVPPYQLPVAYPDYPYNWMNTAQTSIVSESTPVVDGNLETTVPNVCEEAPAAESLNTSNNINETNINEQVPAPLEVIDASAQSIPLPKASSVSENVALPPSNVAVIDAVKPTQVDVNQPKHVNFAVENHNQTKTDSTIENECKNSETKIEEKSISSKSKKLDKTATNKEILTKQDENNPSHESTEEKVLNNPSKAVKLSRLKRTKDDTSKSTSDLQVQEKSKPVTSTKEKARITEQKDGENKIKSTSDTKKSKDSSKMHTKSKHVPQQPETNKASKKYYDNLKHDTLINERSRSLSREVDKAEKKREKILEGSRSRSDEKDILYKAKYDERHSRHRSDRSRYDQLHAERYEEAYRNYHQVEEDRQRQSYDKYREVLYSPDGDKTADLHWYSKYTERDELRQLKRHHHDKNAYSQRSVYIEPKINYQDDKLYEYYRQEMPTSPQEYETHLQSHHHRTKHLKSHKKSSKKHKKHREVSPSSSSSDSSADDNVANSRSSRQRSPTESLEERSSSVIRHKKTLAERLQVLNEFKSFDKKDESNSRPESRNTQVKLEPVSPLPDTVQSESDIRHSVSSNKLHASKSRKGSEGNCTPDEPTLLLQKIQLSHDKTSSSLKQNTAQLNTDQFSNIAENISSLPEIIIPAESSITHDKIDEPKKALQRPWKSPGEKKFMMEQLNNNQQPSSGENDLQAENDEAPVNHDLQQRVCAEPPAVSTEQGNAPDNTEVIRSETGGPKNTDVRSSEVSSTSDTSGKNTKIEPELESEEVILKTETVTVELPKCGVSEMLITTYTQTIESGPPMEEKKTRRRRKPRAYNIGIQVAISHNVKSTQTPSRKIKNADVQVDCSNLIIGKSVFSQTESAVVEESNIKDDNKVSRAKQHKNVLKSMYDLDTQIQKLTQLRQNLYKELECDTSSDDEPEETLADMKKRTLKIPNTIKLRKIESPIPDEAETLQEQAKKPKRGSSNKITAKQKYNQTNFDEGSKEANMFLSVRNDLYSSSNVESTVVEPVTKMLTKASLKLHDSQVAAVSLQDSSATRTEDKISKKTNAEASYADQNSTSKPVALSPTCQLSIEDSSKQSRKPRKNKTKKRKRKNKQSDSADDENTQKLDTDLDSPPQAKTIPERNNKAPIKTKRKKRNELATLLDETLKVNDSRKAFLNSSLVVDSPESNATAKKQRRKKCTESETLLVNQSPSIAAVLEETVNFLKESTTSLVPVPELEVHDSVSKDKTKPKVKRRKRRTESEDLLANQVYMWDMSKSKKMSENKLDVDIQEEEPRSKRVKHDHSSDRDDEDFETAPVSSKSFNKIDNEDNDDRKTPVGSLIDSTNEKEDKHVEVSHSDNEKVVTNTEHPSPLESHELSKLKSETIVESPNVSSPSATITINDDSDSDSFLKKSKQSKPKKKRRSGPLCKTRKRRRSVNVRETTPPAQASQIGVVKVARYSISQLEEMRSTMRYKFSKTEPIDLSDEDSILTKTPLDKSETVLDDTKSGEEVEEVLPPVSDIEVSNSSPPIMHVEMNDDTGSTNAEVATDMTVSQVDSDYKMMFNGFTGAVLVIKVINETVLAATDQGQVLFFNMSNGDIIHTISISKVAITSMLVINHNNVKHIYIGSLNASLTVIDFDTKEVCKEEKVDEPIQCMESAWDFIFIGSDRGSLIRFDLSSGKVQDVTKISENNVLMIKATSEGPRKVLLIATRNAPVCIRDACSGLLLRTLEAPFSHTVYTLLFDRNLVYCGTSQHDILTFTFEDGQLVHRYEATKSKGVVCMQIVGNLLFAGCYNGNIYVYNTKTNNHLGTMTGPGGLMLSMEILVNKIIIVGTKSSNFKAWKIPQCYLDEM